MKKEKKVFSFLDVSIIVIIVSVIMCFLGGVFIYKHLGGVNFNRINEDLNLRQFISAYNNLVDNYYDSLDKKELIDGAISGMYKITGDPYTIYLDQSSSSSLDNSLNGTYEGIGVTVGVNDDNELIIASVYEDSPAEEANVRIGDIIKKVNDEEVTSKDLNKLTSLMQKNKSTKLSLIRDGQEIEVIVSATTLYVPVVSSTIFETNNKRVGYISLSVFNDTSDVQISKQLEKLENAHIDSLILDLRSNGGGYLQMAQNIAEIFLKKGKVIYSLENKDKREDFADSTTESRDYPIDILINGSSASASEILAAALKYSYGAKLVGMKSFGKGMVQERSSLTDGGAIKYTTAKWLTPNGDCIDKIGLSPDIEIDIDRESLIKDDLLSDSQIMAALKDLAG